MIKDLNDKLKLLRLKYGYSQKQVAKILGVSPSIVSGYETGERTPSTEVLLSLSYIYNCTTDYLLGRQNVEAIYLLNTEGISDNQREALVRLIDTMKQ